MKKFILIVFCLFSLFSFVSSSIIINNITDSGKYSSIIQVSEDSNYKITVYNDTSTYQYWLYFNASNVLNKNITFNITNARLVSDSFWNNLNYDFLPQMLYSCDNNNWYRITGVYNDTNDNYVFWKNFTECNEVSIANNYPYPYSKYLNYYEGLSSEYISLLNIGKSVQGRDIYSLKITDFSVNDLNKKVIFIVARQHPGETTSSYMLEGMVNFLLNSSDINASYIRKDFIFYIIPMANPDGVYLGYSRFNSIFKNMNQHWNDNDVEEVIVIRNYITNINSQKQIDVLIDIHNLAGGNANVGYIANTNSNNFSELKDYYKSDVICNKVSSFTNLTDNSGNDTLTNGLNYLKVKSLVDLGVKISLTIEGNSQNYSQTINSIKDEGKGIVLAINNSYPKPIGHWKLNENTGTTAYDSSGNGNNGTSLDNTKATWQNDGVLVSLTEDTDFSINKVSGVVTLLNPVYLFSYITASWTESNIDDSVSMLRGNVSAGVDVISGKIPVLFLVLIVGVILIVLGGLTALFYLLMKKVPSRFSGGV